MNYNVEYLYNEYKKDVYSYLISITHDKALSEDLTSETFLCAIGSIAGFKGQSTIKTWLFGIARNKWYEYLRKQKKDITQDYLLEIYTLGEINIEDKTLNKDCTERIYEILSKQNTKHKEVFLMRVQGYSYSEIGEKYGVSESSARVMDFRIKNKVREILEKEGYMDD